jgi:hypothetical protein
MNKILLSINFNINNFECTSNLIVIKQKWIDFKEFLLNNKKFIFTPYVSNSPIEYYGTEYTCEDLINCIYLVEDIKYIESFKYLYNTTNYYLNFDFLNKLFNTEEYLEYKENKDNCIDNNSNILLLFTYLIGIKEYISIIKKKYSDWLSLKSFLNKNINFNKNGYDIYHKKKYISRHKIFSNTQILENIEIIYDQDIINYLDEEKYNYLYHEIISVNTIYNMDEENRCKDDYAARKLYYLQDFLNEIFNCKEYINSFNNI